MEKEEITKICKEFAKGIDIPINGSGWLIVDPLSAYLNAMGIENKVLEIPKEKNGGKQVLIMEFKDGSQLIPAASDLKGFEKIDNWYWVY